MEKYNGYANYETWLVAVWIDNDQGNIDYIIERAEEIYDEAQEQKYFTKQEEAVILLAEWMKDFYEENMIADTDGLGGLWVDMLTGCLSVVDWNELAGKYMEQALENVEV